MRLHSFWLLVFSVVFLTDVWAQFPVNGDSPYDQLFGRGVYQKGSSHSLVIKNQSDHDVVFCLVSVKTGKTIRNEYVRAHSSFEMTQIPEGVFFSKQLVGKAWDEYADVGGYYLGNFQRERMFSKSDDPEDFLDFRDESHWVEFTITLEAFEWQTGNTMDDIPIDDEEFVI
jgi:hypothetical protein